MRVGYAMRPSRRPALLRTIEHAIGGDAHFLLGLQKAGVKFAYFLGCHGSFLRLSSAMIISRTLSAAGACWESANQRIRDTAPAGPPHFASATSSGAR